MATRRVEALIAVCLLACGAEAARFVQRGNDALHKKDNDDDLTPGAAADWIRALPGFQNAFPSKHFGGYINVDEAHDRNLYYYFVESERDPANDPVVLWLNGGPGCSSFDGFIYEHGPFMYSLQPRRPAGSVAAASEAGDRPAGSVGARGVQVGLQPNPYAWNKVANMIFLDSPAGVGLSYSATAADYNVDDSRTARDADSFLRGWFRRFPQFASNQFFVAGESYAGIYVPNLVRQVLTGNEAGEQPAINVVGYLVGNGCTDQVYDGNAHPLFAAGKSLLPWRGYLELQAECGGSYWNITPGSACDTLVSKLTDNLSYLNVYDTLQYCFHDGPSATTATSLEESDSNGRNGFYTNYHNDDPRARRRNARVLESLRNDNAGAAASAAAADALSSTSSSSIAVAAGGSAGSGGASSSSPSLKAAAQAMTERLRAAGLLRVWPLLGGAVVEGQRVLNWAHVNAALGRLGTTPPCTDARKPCPASGSPPSLSHTPPCTNARVADIWLNDPYVRDAIHAAPASAIGPWTMCSDKINYLRTHGSMIPIHVNNTKGHGLRALIYSGDHDMAVPHTGSEAWTGDMGFPVQQPWQPWFVADGQVAGYVVEYAHGLSYATVKGAGHMVPENNPREALAMFQRFIEGKSLVG